MWILWLSLALADDVDTTAKRLSARHPLPCAQVIDGVDDPVEALRAVADEVQTPPWAGMRAVTCLAEVAPTDGLPHLTRWAADPDKPGLAKQVQKALPTLPDDLRPAVEAALKPQP